MFLCYTNTKIQGSHQKHRQSCAFFTRKCNSLSYFYKDLLNILVSLSSSTYELQEPFPLSEFRSYADVRFTDFLIPEGAITATWSFALMSSPANADRDCDTVQAQV